MIKKRKTMCETKVYYVSKQVFSSCLLVFFNYNYNLTSPFKFLQHSKSFSYWNIQSQIIDIPNSFGIKINYNWWAIL
jgi:hypothetical protein